MALPSGTRLGPYVIDSTVGAGGMGEVYRARDTRLARAVAIKVLPPAFARDADRLRRFDQEARAASQLNHPNILTIFDVGTAPGVLYLVSELLEGETLGDRLRSSALPVRKALGYAAQIADAIAAAHEKGIVHRDLKPDNIFVTRDGRIKVLDFGLAKLREEHAAAEAAEAGEAPTVWPETRPGVLLGTVGYMSPEQVRGEPADARSDIFAFGTVFYEMLTGRRAFLRSSAAETMAAIVHDDPPPPEQAGVWLPPGVARIVDHCLEKNPDERFQSARDLAFDLRASTEARGPHPSDAPQAQASPVRRYRRVAAAAVPLVLVLGVVGAFLAGRRSTIVVPNWFDRMTFRQGEITGARFAADGKSIIYSASWGSAPDQVLLVEPGNPESRPLDLPPARVLSISRSGELAVMLNPQFQGGFVYTGTLARVPPAGGAPRELLEHVEAADWGPEGESLAIVRTVDGRGRLEFPPGTVLFDTAGWINCPRVAPGGDEVAFLHHPLRGNDAGDVVLVNRQRQVKTLSGGWLSAMGLAWAGEEILFSASSTGTTRRLYAVSRSGERRLVASGAGSLVVYDENRDGQVLVARASDRIGLAVRTPADKDVRDMSWLDWTHITDMSEDGRLVVFDETGEGGGARGAVYLRRTDGSPAIRLGDGGWGVLSRDGKWVACVRGGGPPAVAILPTGVGEPRIVATPRLSPVSVAWIQNGPRLLVAGNEPRRGVRYYVVSPDGGAPRPLTPEGSHPFAHALSPDGQLVLTKGPDGHYKMFPIDGGAELPVEGLDSNDVPARMPTRDTVYVYQRVVPMPVWLVDVKSGKRTPVATIGAPRPLEAGRPFAACISADGTTYAYSYFQNTSELFVMRNERR